MSRVYLAWDPENRQQVAVKILSEDGNQNPEAKSRFVDEACMLSGIKHENVVRMYDFGYELEQPFIVMEFLEGEGLHHAMKNGHDADLKHMLGIARQIAGALRHVHERGILHRDIKPSNVFITTTGIVKLIDFGIGKMPGIDRTQTGNIPGTEFYMAPEYLNGELPTVKVDLYAFGTVLEELVTGVKPKKVASQNLMDFVFDSAAMEQAGLPNELSDLVYKLRARRADDRPQGFASVCTALDRILAALLGPQENPTPVNAGLGQTRRNVLILGGAGLAAAAVGGGVLIRADRQRIHDIEKADAQRRDSRLASGQGKYETAYATSVRAATTLERCGENTCAVAALTEAITAARPGRLSARLREVILWVERLLRQSQNRHRRALAVFSTG